MLKRRPLVPPAPPYFSDLPSFTDVPQITPGPAWLSRFKPGLIKRRPRQLLPPAPPTTAALSVRRANIAATASAVNPVWPAKPLLIKTEVLINGTWTDISRYVYARSNVVINRGLPDETQSATPASMTLTLNNRDGRFSPGNPAGAYYPYLTRNTQLRLSLTALSTAGVLVANSYRFWGEVSSWPPRWDSSGTDVYCDITVSGPLRRYIQGAALGSTLRQYYTSLSGNSVPYAIWPAEDGSNAGEIASALSTVSAMTFTGAPGFASSAAFGGSDPLPVISSSAWHGQTGAAASPLGSGSLLSTTPGLHHFTAPPGVTAVTGLTATGAGAGGGDASASAGGGGGGGGGKAISASAAVTGGLTYPYYTGAGGTAGAAGPGGDGEDSWFTGDAGTLTGKGGKGGKLAGGAGGIGGTRTGGAGAAGSSGTSRTFSQTLTGFSGSAGGGADGGHQSQNWVSPITGTVTVTAKGASGGGQGGGAFGQGYGGGAGGGGAKSSGTISVTAGQSYSFQAGNGGNGGSNGGNGGGGGTSQVSGDSGSVSAGGGFGGNGAGQGGPGGSGNTNGSAGGNGHIAITGSGMGGGGGGGGDGDSTGTGHNAPGPNSNPRQPGGGGGDGAGGGWGAVSNGGSSASTGGNSSSGGGGGGGAVTNSTGKVGGGGGAGYITWTWTQTGVPSGGGGGSSAGSAGNGNAGSTAGTGGTAPTGGAAGGSAGTSPAGVVAGGGGAGGVPDNGNGAEAPGAGGTGSVGFSWDGGVTSPVPADIIRFCLDVDSAGAADGAVILRALTYGTVATLDLIYHTGGKLELTGKDISSVQQFDSGQIAFSADGQPLYVDIQLTASGSSVLWSLSAIIPGATSAVATASGSFTGSVGYVSDIFIDPANAVTDNSTAAGWVTVQSYADTLVSLSPIVAGYAGELAADRISRLCAAQGLGFTLTGTNTDTPQMGPQQDDTFVNLLQSCADLDRGQLSETRGSFGIGYRTRVSMQGQNPALSLTYSDSTLAGTLQPTADDQFTRNSITVTRANGASAVAQLTSGSMSVLTPPNGVGIYSSSLTVQAYADSQLANLAAWMLTVGTVDEYRYPSVAFDLSRSAVAGIIDVIAGLDIGDFIQVASPPQFLQAAPVSQLAFGFTETINGLTWTIAANTVPESPYAEGNPPTW